MLPVRELRALSASLPPQRFIEQVGPFALVQRPLPPLLARAALALGAGKTMEMTTRSKLPAEVVAMLTAFDDLSVATLPPLRPEDRLTVGRLPDCDLVLDDPSVSKRHAVLHWYQERKVATVQDLGSTNGTFIGAAQLIDQRRMPLNDGDVVGFGDVQFVYFLAETLFSHLGACGFGGART
ncbi:MAG: FHA domain-containing protein [Myxococcales bacterium]|nr:FHA domain-containing protein [Myxococcales bacterium]